MRPLRRDHSSPAEPPSVAREGGTEEPVTVAHFVSRTRKPTTPPGTGWKTWRVSGPHWTGCASREVVVVEQPDRIRDEKTIAPEEPTRRTIPSARRS